VLTDQGIQWLGRRLIQWGPDEATVAVIRDFKLWLVGQDPRNIEYLWATMYNFTRFPGGAVDRRGHQRPSSTPVGHCGQSGRPSGPHAAGGKCRERVRVLPERGRGDTSVSWPKAHKHLIQKYGYTAIKMAPHPPRSQSMSYNAVTRAAAQRSEAVRNAVGPDIDLAFDAHATLFEPIRALQMAEALKPVRPFWLEEPLRMENMDALAALKHKVEIPIATGECLYTKYDFRQILEKQCADIIQPDIALAGGVMEQKKIAGMADSALCGDRAPTTPWDHWPPW
jgi:galactonate dehydratase